MLRLQQRRAIGLAYFTAFTLIMAWLDYKEKSLESNGEVYQPIELQLQCKKLTGDREISKESQQNENETDQLKYILFWNKRYGRDESYLFGLGREPFLRLDCPESRCYTTSNRKLMNVEDFDALVFHTWKPFNIKDLPKKRKPHQRYISHGSESPQRKQPYKGFFKGMNGFFNWTQTHRLDSDFPYPYARVLQMADHPEGQALDAYIKQFAANNQHLLQNKTKDIAWIVSNCNTETKREYIVEKLIEDYGLEIDIYGKCGPLNCTTDDMFTCYNQIQNQYLFYLSFENTICEDYVTEKLFYPMKSNYPIIPITYNGAEMKKTVPYHSTINVLDFDNLADLVDYITKVKNDRALWTSYFWWRDFYTQTCFTKKQTFCDICAALHDTSMPTKIYEDYEDWWVNQANCRYPSVAGFDP